MIRSARIPPLLNRICDPNNVKCALLVTSDGELLGYSTANPPKDPESFATLIADIASDYARLGEEFAAVDAVQRNRSHMQCLLMEMELGLVGVAACADCFVIALADPTAPIGLVKARVQELAEYIQEALTALSEGT